MYIFKSKEVEQEKILILNDAVITVGDAIKLVPKAIEPSNAVADDVYGIVTGIVTSKGVPINQADSGTYKGTWVNSTQTYTAFSDNETVDRVQALVHPVGQGETLSALMDDTVGTTTGSDLPGYFVSILTTDSTKLDEGTTSTAQQQYITVDNGTGLSSCQDPIRKGNYVLIKVVETGVPKAEQA